MVLNGLERLREDGVCLGGVRGKVFKNFSELWNGLDGALLHYCCSEMAWG